MGVFSFLLLRHFFYQLTRRFGVTPKAMNNQLQLNTEGMNCSHCVKNVKDLLEKVAGVTSCDVSLDKGIAVVQGENVDRAVLAAAVEGAGYKLKV